MADTKITDLTTATTFAAASWIPFVDTTVTTMAASGTDLKITPANLLTGMLPSQAGNSGKGLSTDGSGNLSWATFSGGGGGAPTTATYITQTPDSTLSAEQALSGLATGVLKNTTGTGVLTIASGTDIPASGSTQQLQYNNSSVLGGASKITVGSASGELILGAISAPTISGTGQVWNDSGRFGIVVTKGGGSGPVNVPIWNGVNCTAVANTTSWTSLLAGGTQRGSLTIDGTKLAVGQYLDFDLFGTYGCTASTPTLQKRITVNGTVVGLSPAQAFSASSQTNKYWACVNLPIRVYILATGVSGSMIVVGQTQTYSDVKGYFFSSDGTGSTSSPTAVTVDLSGSSIAIDLQAQWGAASASNTIKLWGGSITLKG